MHQFFYSRQTYAVPTRIHYLKKLKIAIIKYQEAIERSLDIDFKKPKAEVYMTEILPTITALNLAIKHTVKWAKAKKYNGVLPVLGGSTKVIKEPYGIVLVFAPYNYPFYLSFAPLIGAIAAGNCVILKPSEHTPATNRVIKQILSEVFPSCYVHVFEGDAVISEKLLTAPIDYIFFTGGSETAKKIMAKAATHLIPVTLELGGKSPTIVTEDADLPLAAKRIIWGKFINAGQTCVAPDYVLVHESIALKLLHQMCKVLERYLRSPHTQMAHIINEKQYVRLLQLINEDKVVYGGHFHTDSLYIEPTLLYPVDESDLCMHEEIFGPILPIIPYKNLEEAINYVHRRPKPLATYIFSHNKKVIHYLLKQLSFGGGCINDTILHTTHTKAPFGGVGYSGIGSYHGYYSFLTFTHEKTIFVSNKKDLINREPNSKYLLPVTKRLIR